MNAYAKILAAALVLLAGCVTARRHPDPERIAPGFTKDEVVRAIGAPNETTPIPGRPDPTFPVDLWRYSTEPPFDVLFGDDGRVLRIVPAK